MHKTDACVSGNSVYWPLASGKIGTDLVNGAGNLEWAGCYGTLGVMSLVFLPATNRESGAKVETRSADAGKLVAFH